MIFYFKDYKLLLNQKSMKKLIGIILIIIACVLGLGVLITIPSSLNNTFNSDQMGTANEFAFKIGNLVGYIIVTIVIILLIWGGIRLTKK